MSGHDAAAVVSNNDTVETRHGAGRARDVVHAHYTNARLPRAPVFRKTDAPDDIATGNADGQAAIEWREEKRKEDITA